jgi:AAA domain-containing protein
MVVPVEFRLKMRAETTIGPGGLQQAAAMLSSAANRPPLRAHGQEIQARPQGPVPQAPDPAARTLQAGGYPFNLPILEEGRLALTFDRPVTFFTGDNGTGKSTLLEAIAKHCGFGLGGGSRHHQFSGGTHDQPLAQALRLSWLPKVSEGFFLRAAW